MVLLKKQWLEGYIFALFSESYSVIQTLEKASFSISKPMIDNIIDKKRKDHQSLASSGKIVPNAYPSKKCSSSNNVKEKKILKANNLSTIIKMSISTVKNINTDLNL